MFFVFFAKFLEEQRINEKSHRVDEEECDDDKDRVKMLGVGTPYYGKEGDAVPREFEVCLGFRKCLNSKFVQNELRFCENVKIL